jgi:hypothetical protein
MTPKKTPDPFFRDATPFFETEQAIETIVQGLKSRFPCD